MQCQKCAGSMTEGFVADVTHGSVGVSGWVEGAPKRSVWTGLDLKGRKRAEIVTWRCNRCGFLEHYAPRETEIKQKPKTAQIAAVLLLIFVSLLAVLTGVMLAR